MKFSNREISIYGESRGLSNFRAEFGSFIGFQLEDLTKMGEKNNKINAVNCGGFIINAMDKYYIVLPNTNIIPINIYDFIGIKMPYMSALINSINSFFFFCL